MSTTPVALPGGADAALATELLAVDPRGLGGAVVRAAPGPHRDQVCAWVRALAPDAPMLRVPPHVTEDRLLGALSLAATLREGRVVTEPGLLSLAHGGAVVLPMAERLARGVASHLCSALDRGEVTLERDGLADVSPCELAVIALDEGLEGERVPAPLADRLAFHLDLTVLDPRERLLPEAVAGARVQAARAALADVRLGDDAVMALCRAAEALGVPSLRAPLLAARAARAHAALEGRARAEEADVVVAARLVLGPRATRLPPPQETEPQSASADDRPEDQAPPPPSTADETRDDRPEAERAEREVDLDEIVLAAAQCAMPAGVLDLSAADREPRRGPRSAGQAGVLRTSVLRGRPAGTRPGMPSEGARLNLVETLRAAAPWQRIRARAARPPGSRAPLVQVRKQDFRIGRFQERSETSVIFAVDASGSAALQRLAEAKGAVEHVLADCYARRDHVALLAFRGTAATLLLPPTRSLARVRRRLADLAGGGTTPIAAGIDAALTLALEARRRGQTPVIVLMTDGRANVSRDGQVGGLAASADATASARAVHAAGVRAIFLDTAPRPRAQARLLAEAMAARYVPLPRLDGAGIAREVRAVAGAAS